MLKYMFAEVIDGYREGWVDVYYAFRHWFNMMLTPANAYDNMVLFDYHLSFFQPQGSTLVEEHIHEVLDIF